MINEQRTFEVFRYYSTDLFKFSNKEVVHNCDDCGIEQFKKKADLANGKRRFCRKCTIKGSRCFWYNKGHLLSGKQNGRYKDGYTLKKHYCQEFNCKKEVSCRSKYCKKHAVTGERNAKWKGGISELHFRIRGLEASTKWKKAVFSRDFCICRHCGKKKVKLDAHHIKSFHQILSEFLTFYSQFSPIEDKETLVRLSLSWPEFWEVSNGITLCEDCHKLEHSSCTMCTSE